MPNSFLLVTDKKLTRVEPKLKERGDTSFSNTNMFNNLHVEGRNDSDSTRSSSPDPAIGGVSLNDDNPARNLSLVDSDIDVDFRASFDESGLLRVQSAESASSPSRLPSKEVPGGPSRYYYAAKLNGQAPNDRPEHEPKVNPWIPQINSTFWNAYANRLRVYATETEVCHLSA